MVRPGPASARVDDRCIAMGEEMMEGNPGGKVDRGRQRQQARAAYEYSDAKTENQGALRVCTGRGGELRRIDGMSRQPCGKEGIRPPGPVQAPQLRGRGQCCRHCRRALQLQADARTDYGQHGAGNDKDRPVAARRVRGRRGHLSLHTVAGEATGRPAASKPATPRDGDAPTSRIRSGCRPGTTASIPTSAARRPAGEGPTGHES